MVDERWGDVGCVGDVGCEGDVGGVGYLEMWSLWDAVGD